MLGLLLATAIRMFITRPTYLAWNQEMVSDTVLKRNSTTLTDISDGMSCICLHVNKKAFFFLSQATEERLPYPGWALAVLAILIILAIMPVPVSLVNAVLQERTRRTSRDTENGQYSIVSTDDKCDTPMTDMTDLDVRKEISS